MSERADEIAARFEEQFADVIGLVSGLTPADLAVPCQDPQGDTIGAVLAHIREGTDQVLGWAAAVSGQQAPGGPAAARGQADGAGTGVTEADLTAAALRHGQGTLERAIRALTEERLDSIPPAAGELTDGTKRLYEIFDFILEDLRGHTSRMKEALAGQGRLSQGVS